MSFFIKIASLFVGLVIASFGTKSIGTRTGIDDALVAVGMVVVIAGFIAGEIIGRRVR